MGGMSDSVIQEKKIVISIVCLLANKFGTSIFSNYLGDGFY